MIRAVIFDFDGVLVDSVEIKTNAFARLFECEGKEVVQRVLEYHLNNGGISRLEKFKFIYREILYRPLSESKFRSLCENFSRIVVDGVINARWVDGALEFLENNKNIYKFFVVSGTPDEELKSIIKQRGMGSFFDAVFGSPKTKERLLNELINFYGFKRENVVFVGDAVTDWKAASATGVRFIWRRIPLPTSSMINFEGPVISSLHQLEKCLEKLTS